MGAVQKVRKFFKGKDCGSEENYKKQFFYKLAKKSFFGNVHKAELWYENYYMKKMISVLEKKYKKRENLDKILNHIKDKGIKIVVYSDYGHVKERMKAIKINEEEMKCFDLILCSEDYGTLKPSVRPLFEISKRIGVSPEDCLVIGDRLDTDGLGAKNSGMKFIQILTHKTKENVDGLDNPLLSWEEFCSIATM